MIRANATPEAVRAFLAEMKTIRAAISRSYEVQSRPALQQWAHPVKIRTMGRLVSFSRWIDVRISDCEGWLAHHEGEA
jgi:hypothetical protein